MLGNQQLNKEFTAVNVVITVAGSCIGLSRWLVHSCWCLARLVVAAGYSFLAIPSLNVSKSMFTYLNLYCYLQMQALFSILRHMCQMYCLYWILLCYNLCYQSKMNLWLPSVPIPLSYLSTSSDDSLWQHTVAQKSVSMFIGFYGIALWWVRAWEDD
jgi:hypothetical protein